MKSSRKFFAPALAILLAAGLAACATQQDEGLGDDYAPVTPRDRLYDACFVSPTEGWAVGHPGLLLHTIDSGKTWTREKIDTQDALFAIDFSDREHGWIVGRNGLVASTADAGRTWNVRRINTTQGEEPDQDEAQGEPTGQHLFGVHAVSADRVIAVGSFGTVARTDDGGKTWNVQVVEGMYSAHLFSVDFLDENTGFIVGDYPSWEAWMLEEGEQARMTNMFRTDDGGLTWKPVQTVVPLSLYSIKFNDAANGDAVGRAGTWIHTSDGGITWEARATGIDKHLFDLFRLSAETPMWVCGDTGVLASAEDAAMTARPVDTLFWLRAVSFGDSGHGAVVGGGGTSLYTADGGKTWERSEFK